MDSELTVCEALPVTGRALILRTSFNRSLLESLKYLLDACVDVLPKDVFTKVTLNLNSLNPELQLSALLGLLHVDFVNAIEAQDVPRVKTIVERLSEDTYQLQGLTYLNWSNLHGYYAQLTEKTIVYDRIEDIKFLPVDSEKFEIAVPSIQRGLDAYKELFPDFFQEFQELVGQILIINANWARAGSSFDMPSLIFLGISGNYMDKWKDKITGILDLIVHEQSHLYLHLVAANDPLVINRFDRYESPLRKEKRPLIGIYHAAFVLARIQYVLGKVLSSKILSASERGECEEWTDYYRMRCQVGYDILQKHAQMTPLAEALITSAAKLLP